MCVCVCVFVRVSETSPSAERQSSATMCLIRTAMGLGAIGHTATVVSWLLVALLGAFLPDLCVSVSALCLSS